MALEELSNVQAIGRPSGTVAFVVTIPFVDLKTRLRDESSRAVGHEARETAWHCDVEVVLIPKHCELY